MPKNEIALKRTTTRRSPPIRAARLNSSFGWKPHFLRTSQSTLQEPRVVPVYWDAHFKKTPADVAVLDEFLRTLFRSSWMTGLADYGVGPARLMRSFVAEDAPCASLNQAQLEDQLIEWLASEAVMPRPSRTERSLVYLLVTPRSTELTLGTLSSSRDFAGYHDCTAFEPRGGARDRTAAKNLFYAVIPLNATGPEILDAHSRAISTELAEAFIDRCHWLGQLPRSAPAKRRHARAAV